MPGRNKLKNFLNKNLPIYFSELFDVLMSYTGKGGKPLKVKDTEDGIEADNIDAENISYDNYLSDLSADNVQDAIDEIEMRTDEVELGKSSVSSNDSTPDYLLEKLDETENVKLVEVNDGGDESIQIKAPKLPAWDSAYTYSQNDYVIYSGTIYKSLQNSNLNQNPVTETTYWSAFTAGGATGDNGTITAGDTEVDIVVSGEYNRATATAYGLNGGQRQVFVQEISYSSPNTTVTVAIDSSYTEDIDVHVLLAYE